MIALQVPFEIQSIYYYVGNQLDLQLAVLSVNQANQIPLFRVDQFSKTKFPLLKTHISQASTHTCNPHSNVEK